MYLRTQPARADNQPVHPFAAGVPTVCMCDASIRLCLSFVYVYRCVRLQLSPESGPKLSALMQQHLLPAGTQSLKVSPMRDH